MTTWLKTRSGMSVVAAVLYVAGLTGCHGITGGGHTSDPFLPSIGEPLEGKRSAPKSLPPEEAAKACLTTANTLAQNAKYREAIALYERARALDPELDASVSRVLANIYDIQGRFDMAAGEYRRALEYSPDSPDLLNDIGYSHYSRGDWAKAEQYFNRTLHIAPGHKQATVNLGMTLAQAGRYEESLETFEKSVTPGQARANLAFILMAQDKEAEARKFYSQALQLEPELEVARRTLAHMDRRPEPGVATVGHEVDAR